MKDVKKEVIEKIKEDKVKPHSKVFFRALKVLGVALLGFLGFLAVFSISLSLHLPRRGMGPGAPLFPVVALATYPWPIILIGLLAISFLIYLYVKYEGGYKKSIIWTAIVIIALVMAVSIGLHAIGVHKIIDDSACCKGMYDWGENNLMHGRRGPRNLREMPFRNPNNQYLKDIN